MGSEFAKIIENTNSYICIWRIKFEYCLYWGGCFSKSSICIFLFFIATTLCSLDANSCKLQGQNFLRREVVLIVCEKVCSQILCFLRISKKKVLAFGGGYLERKCKLALTLGWWTFSPDAVSPGLAFTLRISLCVSRETWAQSHDLGLSWWDPNVRVSRDGAFILEKLHGPDGSSPTRASCGSCQIWLQVSKPCVRRICISLLHAPSPQPLGPKKFLEPWAI